MKSYLQKTIQDVCKDWKAGKSVWTVELGGISPGYEQCIQIMIFEICSSWTGKLKPFKEGDKYPEDYSAHVDKVVGALDKKYGFSGAQVGSAKLTAFQFLVYGYSEMMAKAPEDRIIQTQRHFPSLD